MRQASTSIILFVLIPAAIALVCVPTFGILDFAQADAQTQQYLLLFYLPAILAAVALLFWKQKPTDRAIEINRIWPLAVLSCLSIIDITVSIADLVLSRNVLTVGISAAWQTATDEGARNSIQGAIGLVLSGAPTLFLSLAILQPESQQRRDLVIVAAIVLFSLSLICMLASSSRNSVVVSIAYIGTVAFLRSSFCRKPVGALLDRRLRITATSIAISLTLVALFGIILFLFVERANLTHGSVDQAIAYFLEEYRVELRVAPPENSLLKSVFYSLMMLEFYVTHPSAYFSSYIAAGYCPGGHGAYSFYGLFRVIDFLIGTQFVSAGSAQMILHGVYLTLPGFLFLDFCDAGILVGWIILAATTLSLAFFFSGNPSLIFATAYLLCVFLFAPFYALPSIGDGMSLMLLAVSLSVCRVLTPLCKVT